MTSPAIVWFWEGDVLRPARRFEAQARRELEPNVRYILEPVEEEQSKRDMAYHCFMREVWMQLSHELRDRFPNPRSFRRHCLARCGYATVTPLALKSERAAQEAALELGKFEDAMIAVDGAVVTVIRPLSQRMRGGMKKEQRFKSYEDTQEYAASLIGVSVDDVSRNAKEAA